MSRELLAMALDALTRAKFELRGVTATQDIDEAVAALRKALAAPEPEPVALESVHLTRDTRGMCVVRVNGRVAIRDNGDIIDHMATLEWFATPPAAPAPDGWVMVPREPTQKMERAGNDVGLMGMSSLGSGAVYRAMIAASPAAPVVREPLRDDAFHAWVEEASADHPNLLERQEFRDAMYNAWINGYNTRVDEQAHGITGASK